MNVVGKFPAAGKRDRRAARSGITLLEMLVVVGIIALLASLLFPALNSARETSRRAACQSNLRQIGVGLQDHASRQGEFCSGAFDWRHDGCVTEVGWVADLVNAGIPVGQMLCPSNPYQISQTYNDLMGLAGPDPCACLTPDDLAGSGPKTLPDGSVEYNPCRYILDNPDGLDMSPGSQARRAQVEERVFGKHYNTNYTASWLLVRTEPLLTASGNLKSCAAGCGSLESRGSTVGPLTLKRADGASAPSSSLPLLGCGAASGMLQYSVGEHTNGEMVVASFTAGPILSMNVPGGMGTALGPPGPFDEPNPSAVPPKSGTPRDGPLGVGWWAAWNACLQDYRRFAPVHRGMCNVLFADGSVRAFTDENEDGLLNNGFTLSAAPGSGFADDVIELPQEGVFSRWSLRSP